MLLMEEALESERQMYEVQQLACHLYWARTFEFRDKDAVDFTMLKSVMG